jgi:hypothetical protein
VRHDFSPGFEFLTGTWRVDHRYLARRLNQDRNWLRYEGTCRSWPMMGGQSQVDEYEMNLPGERRRAMAIRAYDPGERIWSIWWIDSRDGSSAGEPVRGTFVKGVGTFYGDDLHDSRPVRVRFIWSGITATTARWEQAYSADGGRTWETNWTMSFRRSEAAE